MYDFLLIFIVAALGLLAHMARNRGWLEWVLRVIIFSVGLWEGLLVINSAKLFTSSWPAIVLTITCLITLLLLFIQVRQIISWLFTGLNLIITGQALSPVIRKKIKAAHYFASKRIYIPNSFPHLVALFIYVSTIAYWLMNIQPVIKASDIPVMTLFSVGKFQPYGGIALILLSLCGVGIYISRSGKEVLNRLGLVKPRKPYIYVGIILILLSFTYDVLWIIYTHNWGRHDLATQFSYYNAETFTMAGSFWTSLIVALVVTLSAGIGEEILFRGALQPVFGIVPAALLQGILYGQMIHSPALIVQVSIWSIFMGLVKRYTNTTTTIIGHAGLNLITTLLFALNP